MFKSTDILISVKLYFLFLAFFWGFDFGFQKSLKIKIRKPAKVFCFIVQVVISLILLSVVQLIFPCLRWFILFFLQYIIYLLIINTQKYTMYDFVINIYLISKQNMPEMNRNNHYMILFIYSHGFYILKTAMFYINCNILNNVCCHGIMTPYNIYGLFNYTTDLPSAVLVFINYYLYCCVKSLKATAEETVLNTQTLLKQYQALAECHDKIKPFYGMMVSKSNIHYKSL